MEKQENSNKYLDIKQKVKVIKEASQGKKVIEVARVFGVSVGQVTRYSNQEGLYLRIIKIPHLKRIPQGS